MAKPEDHGAGDVNNPYCKFCTTASGRLKSYDEVLNGYVGFLTSQKMSRLDAEKKAREALSKMPAWKQKVPR